MGERITPKEQVCSDSHTGWRVHDSCNMHCTKTGGLSPIKLYTKEMIRLRQTNLPAFDYFDSVSEYYGSEDDDVVASPRSTTY